MYYHFEGVRLSPNFSLGGKMEYKLSFADINVLANNAIEIVIKKNIEVSLEMVEESHILLSRLFPHETFGILMNRIHPHSFTYEAKLCMGTYENLAAIAVVNYSPAQLLNSQKIHAIRKVDNWNLKHFEGLDLGWQDAQQWLKSQLPLDRLSA